MKATTDRANQIGTLLDILPGQVRELRRAVDEADTRAIQTGMDNLRSTIDMLESLTDADLWPVPTYAELLFL
jgi:glutamine synthetase